MRAEQNVITIKKRTIKRIQIVATAMIEMIEMIVTIMKMEVHVATVIAIVVVIVIATAIVKTVANQQFPKMMSYYQSVAC